MSRSRAKTANQTTPVVIVEPYNPLAKIELARSVEAELLSREVIPLADVPKFAGAGIYVLYYLGPNPLYKPLSGKSAPIYVGRAVPKGARKGETDERSHGTELWDRIQEHRESINQVSDLAIMDFSVRHLVTEELFIPLAERLMLSALKPVWNRIADGFGNHDPGSGRKDQKRSKWDTLHPGRPWAEKLAAPKDSRETIMTKIAAHFTANPVTEVFSLRPPVASIEIPDIEDEEQGEEETD